MANGKNKKKRLIIISIVAIAVVALVVVAVAATRSGTKIDPTKLAKVEKGDLAKSVVATGKVTPITKVEIKSKASGIVKKLYVDAGDRVKKDQVLAELDRDEIEAQVNSAFVTAGWHHADPLSKRSVAHNFYAVLNNSGYTQEPMMTFLLNGTPEDMNWQKSLNSYGRRDHLRIWRYTPEGAAEPVWLSASTHDSGAMLSLKYKGFVHHISPDIDNERSTVIRDLNFAGCVKSVTYVERPGIAAITQNAVGDTYIRREILTFRNDIWRANIVYGVYDLGRMAIAAMRHPLPPVDSEAKPTISAFRPMFQSSAQQIR